ncbi:MAG: SDR family oxidoreductase [Ignavibacteriaceae bacterium]
MKTDLFSLKGKSAIVTGATGLIGKYHCRALSMAGADLVVSDIDELKCTEFAKTLDNNAVGVGCDITNRNSVKDLLNRTKEYFGKVDILVNNAAINDMFENPESAGEESKFENYPLHIWQKSLDVNLTGTFLCCQIIGSDMAANGKGSIINIASTYGITAPDQSLYIKPDGSRDFYKSPAYSATKGAIISFTKFLAAYWGNKGVRVNTLTPGGVENNQADWFISKYSERTPLGRMAKPDDYMGAIVFLASDASDYMTGANLIVDGGWTAW